MRIEQLEYVTAVTQHGSLRRASESLHLSQPALSEAISRLERELGVSLLDRHRSGARISREGQELLPHMAGVLEAVDRLRLAAGDQRTSSRVVRVGTVNAATTTVLVPAVRSFQDRFPATTVEILDIQQAEIQRRLLEGSLDLGLVTVLAGDEAVPQLTGTDLLHGRPVVVMPVDHPLAREQEVGVEQLREQRFVAMRAGYLMHRFVHRLLGGELPRTTYHTDGADMGKLMVAEGLGVTVLPDYSVTGDPLERSGLLTTRPIRGDGTRVTLELQQRTVDHVPAAVRELHASLLARSQAART